MAIQPGESMSHQSAEPAPGAIAASLRTALDDLHSLEPSIAVVADALAFVLARIAHADTHICDDEIRQIESILRKCGNLPEEIAILIVEIAMYRRRVTDAAAAYTISRNLRDLVSGDDRQRLLECCFEVAAADGAVSVDESTEIEQLALELGFGRAEIKTARQKCLEPTT